MPDLLTGWALAATVLMLSALGSRLVERAPVSFPMIFLALGFLLGPRGLGLLEIDSHDKTLEAVAILSLALVLFLDAVRLRFDELGKDWRVPMLSLGPGAFITIALVGLAYFLLFERSIVMALMLAAVLASTDPVVLRDVVRNDRIPRSVRRALAIEAGTNDIVVLPIVLVLIAIATTSASSLGEWASLLGRLFILSPLAGFVVGATGAWLIEKADSKFGISREFQSLYGIGLVLACYVAGEAAGGDGFLSAFAGGAAVTAFNYELCDCFLDYGEVTAEMAMLFTFILFGAVLSVLLSTVDLLPALLLGVLAIFVARPLALFLVLHSANLSWRARGFIGWFGPRGLNSLLLALLIVRGGVPGGEGILGVVGVVVVLSITLHGVTASPFSAWYARSVARSTLSEERESEPTGLFRHEAGGVPRITVQELAFQLAGSSPPIVLDVRSRSSYTPESGRIPGSIRVLPDQVAEWAAEQPRVRDIVAYCT